MVSVVMWTIYWTLFIVVCDDIVSSQTNDRAGPWTLVYKVVSGKWNAAATGHSTFKSLYESSDSYESSDQLAAMTDFGLTSDHYKSVLLQDWDDSKLSVQSIKLSFFKNNAEQAYFIFDAFGKTKSLDSWFKCNNIIRSSYTDTELTDGSLGTGCPGTTSFGFPLSIQQTSFLEAPCPVTTGWTVVVDTNLFNSFCTDYAPYSGVDKPYFKYSINTGVADLSTELESADSIALFIQVWDMVLKGVRGIKPADPDIRNMTQLWTSPTTENHQDTSVKTLDYSPAEIYKSHIVNLWDSYFFETVKYSMFGGGLETAFVVFNGINSESTSWFADDTILYSSYSDLIGPLANGVCSIEGDSYRNWQIQKTVDNSGCTDTEHLGWMLVKEPKVNGTCSWDSKTGQSKPYYLYSTSAIATNPSTFAIADAMAIFVHGWRLVFKVSAGTSVSPKSNMYSLWAESDALNQDNHDARSIAAGQPAYKSDIIDNWASYYIKAVKVAVYENGQEVFHVVFDAHASDMTSWFQCDRILYTSVTGAGTTMDPTYTCSVQGASSSFRFMIGKESVCGTMQTTGVLSVVDVDSTCTSLSGAQLPRFMYSNTLGVTLDETTTSQVADTFAVFLDMTNCVDGLCQNGATCEDIGGTFYCYCVGDYYGDTCANLDGTYSDWSAWSDCSVTCAGGTTTRSRTCQGTAGAGVCYGDNAESLTCNTDPCPIDGGWAEWTPWDTCTTECGTGSQSRSRDCTNPAPQHGGAICTGDNTNTQQCNTHNCPIEGGWSDWTLWTTCPVTCNGGIHSRSRDCTNPEPQYGGLDCTGATTEEEGCNSNVCPPVDGAWSDWSAWTTCSFTCNGGDHSRNRTCSNPEPHHGGADCSGQPDETADCNTNVCPPIDGGWSAWGAWDTCTVTCNGGSHTRSRDCSNPPPQYGGVDCPGSSTDTDDCNTQTCPPINGGWSDWTAWTTCPVTCSSGSHSRSRGCSNPLPQYGGNVCAGESIERAHCNTQTCPPIHGGWSTWGTWSQCTLSCGSGSYTRSRDCDNPVPTYGGLSCSGESTGIGDCNTHSCPAIDGSWSEWSEWSQCTDSCGIDTGTQYKTRTCTDPSPQWEGNYCSASNISTTFCNNYLCPVDGMWTVWSEWTDCDHMSSGHCGLGNNTRNRTCDDPVPQYNGVDCAGNDTDVGPCAINCLNANLNCDPPSYCYLEYNNTGRTSQVSKIPLLLLLVVWMISWHR